MLTSNWLKYILSHKELDDCVLVVNCSSMGVCINDEAACDVNYRCCIFRHFLQMTGMIYFHHWSDWLLIITSAREATFYPMFVTCLLLTFCKKTTDCLFTKFYFSSQNFIRDISEDKEDLIKCWKLSASRTRSKNFLHDSSTLWGHFSQFGLYR